MRVSKRIVIIQGHPRFDTTASGAFSGKAHEVAELGRGLRQTFQILDSQDQLSAVKAFTDSFFSGSRRFFLALSMLKPTGGSLPTLYEVAQTSAFLSS